MKSLLPFSQRCTHVTCETHICSTVINVREKAQSSRLGTRQICFLYYCSSVHQTSCTTFQDAFHLMLCHQGVESLSHRGCDERIYSCFGGTISYCKAECWCVQVPSHTCFRLSHQNDVSHVDSSYLQLKFSYLEMLRHG